VPYDHPFFNDKIKLYMKDISSKALEANIAEFAVEVTIDPKYHVIQEVMSGYGGLQKQLNTFLEELCHPRRNWQFIINEFKTFSLGYMYDLRTHPKGPEAVRIYIDIAVEAIENAKKYTVKEGSFNNLYLLLQGFIKESGPELEKFLDVINYGFSRIKGLKKEYLPIVARSYYQLKRVADAYLHNVSPDAEFLPLNSLLIGYFKFTFSYWLSEKDPLEWFENETAEKLSTDITRLFKPIAHLRMKEHLLRLDKISGTNNLNSAETLETLIQLPGYGDIVDLYNVIPDKVYQSVDNEKLKHQYKLIFLFHTMNISGLSTIHEETLREINRDIEWIIGHEDIEHVQHLIETTFSILSTSFEGYPDTVLKSVLNMGKGVYETNESDLVHFFNEHVVKLGFQTPDFTGISDDWQIRSNLAHIQNIRAWMELIKLNPKWSRKLFSSLIIHLSLSGVLIKDTDLFPRDITGFLNADMRPVYNLLKQLMRLFPAYFNEIGAEGRLREISTEIDEICKRQDILIHFLRKQSHVESSNKIISLVEAILGFWLTKSKEELRPYLPSHIFEQIEEKGEYINGVSKVINYIFKNKGFRKITDLLSVEDGDLSGINKEFSEDHEVDVLRVSRAVSLYKVLNEKYCITSCLIDNYLTQAESSIPLNINELRSILSTEDTYTEISSLLNFLQQLKDIILSPEPFDVREDIYRKRHIAADIPSMYGSYHEAKFDSLGLTFRLEATVNTLFEELVENFDLSFITHATFYRIYEYLKLFNQALNIDGIPAREFEEQLELLDKSLNIKFVTYTQYLDIFRGFTQVVRNIVTNYFSSIHKENLIEISETLPLDKLLPKYRHESDSRQELNYILSEIILRDTIASSLGLQKLDLFLTRILNTLHEQAERLPVEKHHLLITYNPRNIVTSIEEPYSDLYNIIHLGNKSLNIIRMREKGLPVPPGFIVTTEIFRCRELIENYPPARNNFREQVDRQIAKLEKTTGKTFGSPENALLVSVRSGAAVSQPGMLDSYLNVGMNEAIVEGMVKQTGEEWFAWDSYRRFLQSYGMSFGLKRDSFDAIIDDFKKRYKVPLKKDFSPVQTKEVALAYKELIHSNGINVEESPRDQLYIAIERVLNSWDTDKARTYRKIIGISDDWGTAVTVQKMVFGNISQHSGSGVLFTHSPKFSRDVLRLWGDYTIGNQGEDVVSGLVSTYPISICQAKFEKRAVEYALEARFPEIYYALREYSKVLIYENQWAAQDIEFTFEGPDKKDLYLLQTRDMEIKERKTEPSFVDASEMMKKFIGHGIGVSGGALTGRVVFNLDDIAQWRKAEPETLLVLIRNDTVPDDIKEIAAADGLLTARGGATSHASIVATRLEKTCVVGCRDLICIEKDKKFTLNQKTVHAGDFISIDGSEGSIYSGKMQISEGRG